MTNRERALIIAGYEPADFEVSIENALDDAEARGRRLEAQYQLANGCFSGDCPHDNVNSCVSGIEKSLEATLTTPDGGAK